MEKWVSRAGPAGRLVYLVLLAALVVLALGVMAPTAFGFGAWSHDGASCGTGCHISAAGTGAPGTNAECQACHTGFQRRDGLTQDCWTCHAPGQAMAPSKQQAGCTGTCHFHSGGTNYADDQIPHGPTPHYASTLKNCGVCHGVTVSATNPDASPHHDLVNATAPTAATCLDCHGTPPVDGATPAHGDLNVGVPLANCQHCHVGMATAHPTAVQLVTPRLTAAAARAGADVRVSGTLKRGTVALVNFTGWVQWKGPADTTWDSARQLPVTTDASGRYTVTVTAPLVGTAYRTIFEGGIAGAATIRPSMKGVATNLTLRVAPTIIRLSRRVTASGTVTPARTGANVTLTIQRKNANGRWVKITTKRTALKATGGYSTTYRPGRKGTFRIQARIAASGDFAGDLSPWRTFRVR